MRNELSYKAGWWFSSKNFFISKANLWNQPDFVGFKSVEAQTQAKPTTTLAFDHNPRLLSPCLWSVRQS